MKRQFLGDSRDSFKWDLLHHVVTEAVPSFHRLVFVPMLTSDEEGLSHGSTPPSRFPCRPGVLRFCTSLREEPRKLERVAGLGVIPGLPRFSVEVFQPERQLGFGWHRVGYWRELAALRFDNDLVFLDPDNGFESVSSAGTQHLRFGEAELLLRAIPTTAALCVFQYRPQGQSWAAVFERVEGGLPRDISVCSIMTGQLAFVFLWRSAGNSRVEGAVANYGKRLGLQCRSRRAV